MNKRICVLSLTARMIMMLIMMGVEDHEYDNDDTAAADEDY